MLDAMLQDTRYAVRMFVKSPLFTATAALSLAIGIGANATIFSIASALLLRPLPGLADPNRLVDIGRTQNGSGFDTVSYLNYRDFRSRSVTLADVYAGRLDPEPMSLSGPDGAERIHGVIVSANYFSVLGTRPFLGRLLQNADDEGSGNAVVVISRELWERRYASDPAVVGQQVVLNGHPFTIVGVTPQGFQGTTVLRPEAWVPMSMTKQAMPRLGASLLQNRGAVWLFMGGRLKDGVTVARADAEAKALGAALEREFPNENRGKGFTVARTALIPGGIAVVAGFIGLLLVFVGLVLMIACANVTGMLLARAAARRREIAVRLAIGAGPGRLVRQLLTETIVLFVFATVLGVLLSNWLAALLLAVLPQLPVPVALDVVVDWRVVTMTAAVSLVAAVLSGLAPALQASRADLVAALKTEGLDGGPSRLRLRNAFIVGQLTLSLVLIIGAGLFLRALHRATSIDPGFDQHNVELIALDLALGGYDEPDGHAFLREFLDRIRAMPVVEAASAATDLPLDGGRFGLGGLRVPGVPIPDGRNWLDVDWNVVEPGYFRTLRLPLTRGRDFAERDTASSPLVAIINEALARLAFPGQDPIGRQMEWGRGQALAMVTVVGVTADAKLISLDRPASPTVYVAHAQQYVSRMRVVVRTTDGRSAIPQVRALLRGMNPNLPPTDAIPLEQLTAYEVIPQRIAAAVAGSLGMLALMLAAIGIFGVTSYAVAHRTREIGIRMALGADRSSVRRMVLRQALTLAGIGIALGIGIAAVGSKLLESVLFGVRGLDPLAFGGACALFVAIALLASYIPARRAMSVDPMVALRNE